MRTDTLRKIVIALVILAVTGFAVFFGLETARKNTTETTTVPETTTTGSTALSAQTTSSEATTEATTHPVTEVTTSLWPTTPETRGADPAGYPELDGELLTWWFQHPEEPHQDIKTGTGDRNRELMAQYNGIWQQDTDEKVLYLTMDEGYEYGTNTAQILDIAAEKEIPITFFITGDFLRLPDADGTPGWDLAARMIDEGHLVASHTWKHPNLPNLLEQEGVDAMVRAVTDLADAFEQRFGRPIAPFIRPPGGAFNERTLKILGDIGYRPVFWSYAYVDWTTDDQPDPVWALDQVTGELHPGAVYLLHAVSDTNVAILPDFIDAARAAGYRFERLDNLP